MEQIGRKILAIIPARSGSKSVKDKNIRMLGGKPMLAHSIMHAKESKYINRILLSTDSETYAQIGREYGAEVPFLRPTEFATDEALDYDVFYHALTFLKEKEGYVPDAVVQLRPTYPIRNVEDIDAMIEILLNDVSIDSVRSLSPAKEIPYKMWKKSESGMITPAMNEIPEAYNMPRQKLPQIYYQNACVDVIRSRVILKERSMSGKNIAGYEMKDNFDIDMEEEFVRADHVLGMKQGKKRFVFDIDGVIAQIAKDLDYSKALPNERMISIVNQLYDWGNEIILFTARGYVTKIDWYPVTLEQMKKWGVKFHELHMGKPNADYYVDDHMLDLKFLYDEFDSTC